MANSPSDDLFPEVRNPKGIHVINERCRIITRDGHRVVLVSGVPIAQYVQGDRMSEAHAMISLIDLGWADQNDVAEAFGCSARTLRRHQRRFEAGGLAALGRPNGYPPGLARLATTRQSRIKALKAQGCSHHEMARQLGVSVRAVRKTLRRLGWKAAPPGQTELPLDLPSSVPPKPPPRPSSSAPGSPASGGHPNLSALSAAAAQTPLPSTCDTDPSDRWTDRLFARLGLLEDAAPLFGSAPAVPRAGVLLALPVLVASGVFECAQRVYGTLGPAFYGLRTSVLTLLLMALWRIKRPEGLKEHSPPDLGRVLGLDRAPEVKTLRRKLARLAATGRAAQFGQALAEQRVARRGTALGFLYIDGHVRVYHGKHRLPKTHVTRLRISLPATSDYWVNDTVGDPLFVITAEANAGLVKMLPKILAQIRGLVGQRRVTVVFDRGGYSPKLFLQIVDAGFDVLTYRKGRLPRIPRHRFRPRRLCVDGQSFTYVLADQEVRLLKGKLRLRQVTRLKDNGHRTPILTSRRDLSASQVAYRMFNRWRQENFLKYLCQEYALDALVEYATVPDDPHREVPNPARATVDAQLRQAQAQLDRLEAEYGVEALANLERQRPTMRGFKIAQGKLGQRIGRAWQRVEQLEKRRTALPPRVPVGSLTEEPVVKLAPERKHLTNVIKIVAYQAESDLLRLVGPYYRRVGDEGRTLIQPALATAADLQVTEKELRVVLAPQSAPHRTRAIAALCEELNRTNTCFPGSSLHLHFAIRENR